MTALEALLKLPDSGNIETPVPGSSPGYSKLNHRELAFIDDER